jgi:hypothetical protein
VAVLLLDLSGTSVDAGRLDPPAEPSGGGLASWRILGVKIKVTKPSIVL